MGPDGPVMPQRVITKPPTRRAAARPEGRGQPAALFVLDRILEGAGRQGDVGHGGGQRDRRGRALVADIESKLLRAEYKRRQAPPGVKIGSRNFGRDRRYPISNFFHTGPGEAAGCRR